MYTLYYYPLNASMAPHFVLQHIGCEFDLQLVDRKKEAQKSEAYRRLNPLGKIPVFVDNDLTIFESSAICLHLADKHPEASLSPTVGTPERAKFYQWLMFLTNTLQTELMMYFYPEKHGITNTDAVKATQEIRIADLFSLLDKELADKCYLLGKKISVCDYYLFMLSIWADEIQRPPLTFSNLQRYLRHMATKDAIVRACKTEGFSLKDYK